MSDVVIPGCCSAAGIQLDLRRMGLPNNLTAHYGALIASAIDNMQAIERGDTVNVDENWQVGHYWLRNPGMAPSDYGQAIESALAEIKTFYEGTFKSRFRKILWVGIGGSGLGPQMVHDVLRVPGETPAIFFFDNTDPGGMQRTLDEIEQAGGLADTLTVVVSKSGSTPETANGMSVAKQAYESAGLKFEEHAAAVTKVGSQLDQTARKDWLGCFPMWDWVGGRTSVFSAVGMLPARLLGFDVEQLLAGAKAMDEATRVADFETNPALQLACAWYHTVETAGLKNMVVLPYCDRLALLGKYLQQLIMESLGKDGKGITVYGNKGSTDQHSYVQQLREGYRDFFAAFVRVMDAGIDWNVADEVTVSDYLAAFQEGTAQALYDAGRPSLRMTIDQVNATTLGALIALFERTVGYYGAMLGINAYHQPGVEAGKKAAGAILALQAKLVDALRKNSGQTVAVSLLAKEAKTTVAVVYDILDRLARHQRFGVVKIVQGPTDLADVQFQINS